MSYSRDAYDWPGHSGRNDDKRPAPAKPEDKKPDTSKRQKP